MIEMFSQYLKTGDVYYSHCCHRLSSGIYIITTHTYLHMFLVQIDLLRLQRSAKYSAKATLLIKVIFLLSENMLMYVSTIYL